jgi:hypothetical protein
VSFSICQIGFLNIKMKKILNWIFKSKVDLTKKWWHRFLKVLFIIVTIIFSIYLSGLLVNSYNDVTNSWTLVESLSTRLGRAPYTGKVHSIHQLYGENEVISEKYTFEMNNTLVDKEYLFPYSALFLKNDNNYDFCSDDLTNHISNIASTNDISLFSTTNPSFETLYSDIDVFNTYLKNNSLRIQCVFIDSYTIPNIENGSSVEFVFLRPVITSEYQIYRYENHFMYFILMIIFEILFILFCILCSILIYYKVVLYIVYGKIQDSSTAQRI